MEKERDITNIVLVGYMGTGKTTVGARPQKGEFAGKVTSFVDLTVNVW